MQKYLVKTHYGMSVFVKYNNSLIHTNILLGYYI